MTRVFKNFNPTGSSGPVDSTKESSSTLGNPSQAFTDILSEIEKYKDNSYIYEQLMNSYNKYATQKFSPTLLQSLGEGFGDYSAHQNFVNSQISGLRTEMSKILEGLHTEEYTDPSAEIQRRRQAGINDDLSGGSQIGTGDPAEIDNPDVEQSLQNDGHSSIQQVAQIGTSIVSFAMQMYTGFQNVKSLTLDNALKELSVSNVMREIAWNVISEGVSEFLGSNKGKFTREEILDPSFVQLQPSLIQSFGSRINSLPLSYRQKRFLRSIIDDLTYTWNGDVKVPTSKFQTIVNGMNSDLFKSRNALAQSAGLIGADADNIDVIRAIGEDIYKPLNEQSIQITKALNEVTRLQAQFKTDYLSEANKVGLGKLSASSEYASREFVTEMNNARNNITQAFKEIRDKILGDRKLKEGWKTALLTGSSIAEVFTMNQLSSGISGIDFGIWK